MDMGGDVLRQLFLKLANTFSSFDKTMLKNADSGSGTFTFDRKEVVTTDCEGSASNSYLVGDMAWMRMRMRFCSCSDIG